MTRARGLLPHFLLCASLGALPIATGCGAPAPQSPSGAPAGTPPAEGAAARGEGTRPPPAGDPAQDEVLLPAGEGWQASLVVQGEAGIWTCGAADVFAPYGCPEVIGLDDRGRCLLLVSYSGKWTPRTAVHDGQWLGALAHVDLDPRHEGRELYVGGQRGHLYQIRPHRDGTLGSDVVLRVPGHELHTAVAGDLLPSRAGHELLVFTGAGQVWDVRPAAGDGYPFDGTLLADLGQRVREAVLLPAATGEAPAILGVSRGGEVLSMRLEVDGLSVQPVLREPMGLGRVALAPGAGQGGAPLVAYACRDDGLLLRLVERAGGAWEREAIHAGPQGPRGLAAGRFDSDPRAETLAVFGYSGRVQLLRRLPGEAWTARTIFTDADKGHWLAAAELDGRNGTDELLASGYAGRIVLLARPPGYGLDVAVDDVPPLPGERPAAGGGRGR